LTNVSNKLECLFLEGLSSLLQFLWARKGKYPRVDNLKGVSLGPYTQTLD